MGGSSKRVTVGYKYYLGIHMVLCHGPIDKLVALEINNKIAWSGTNTGTTINVDAKNLFGGEDREGGVSGKVDVDMGGPTQGANSYLQARLGPLIPAYRGVVSVILKQVYIGLNPYLKRWAFWGERIHTRQNGIPQWYDSVAAIGNDMNPAHILRECLTDPGWGMGYPEHEIDDTSFMGAADQLLTEQMGMSLLWDKAMTIEDFIQLVLKHIDASIYVDRVTGLFVLKLIRKDYLIDNVLVLDEDSVEKISNFKRNTVSELINSVTVVYWDATTGKKGSVTVQDIALAAQQQATINTTKQFPGFTNGEIASRVASRTLKAVSVPLACASVYANRKAAALNIGDVFVLSWPRYGLVQVIMRVLNVELGTLDSNVVKIEAVEDVFSMSSAIYAAPPPSEWSDPNNAPAPCPFHVLQEATYWEIVQRLGETEAQAKTSDASYAVITGVRPTDDATNAKIWSDPTGTGFEETGTVDFCPTALIGGEVNYTDTVIPLTSALDVDIVDLGSYATLGNEIVEVAAITNTELTIVRGCLDTIPQQHATGDRVFFPDAFFETDRVEYVETEGVAIKLLPTTAQGTLVLGAAIEQNITMVGRLSKPYPPGALRLNLSYYADSVAGDADLVVNWAHRDRLQQTATMIGSENLGNIGPEANTTYNVEIRTLEGALVSSQMGLTSTTVSFTLSTLGSNYGRMRVLLSSHRDSIDCLQSHDYEFTRAGYGAGYGYAYGGS